MSTRSERRVAEKYRKTRENYYVSHFLSILHNSVNVKNLPNNLPKRYLLGVLFRKGKIGYYGNSDGSGLYLPAAGTGVDVYGLPTHYILTGYNGKVITKQAKDVVIMRINDLSLPVLPYLKIQSSLLANIDTAINQNLDAIRTMTFAKCRDQKTLLSIKNAWDANRMGATVAFIAEDGIEQSFVTLDTGAQYLLDRLLQDRSRVMQDTLQSIGVATTVNKNERVQSIEVQASNMYAYSNLQTIVDTFNYDAEIGGLPIRLEKNEATSALLEQNAQDAQEVSNSNAER